MTSPSNVVKFPKPLLTFPVRRDQPAEVIPLVGGISDKWERPAERPAPPAEDLTPEGIQLVIPGAERIAPASQKQLDLF